MASLLSKGKLGIIGVGVMGQTMLQGLLNAKLLDKKQIWAAAKTEASCEKIKASFGIETRQEYADLLPDTEILLLCVKPHQILAVLENLKASKKLGPETLIISVVTGVTLSAMGQALESKSAPNKNPLIRAMPNTPSVVGQGMTVVCPGHSANREHLHIARKIFESCGQYLELEENHFDAVTALSGCGPAYFYLIMEALADGGVRVGLPRDVALKIVSQTMLGAATMVRDTGHHPASLRDDVTTPAGCTIGALLTMEDGKIRSVLARAVEEATRIAGELGQKK